MTDFSLDWFKSKKAKKLLKLIVKEQILKTETVTKHYKKLKLVNDVLTVVLTNGEVLSKPSSSVDDFDKVRNATSELNVIELFKNDFLQKDVIEEIKRQENLNKLSSKFHLIEDNPDFEVVGNSVKLRGIDRTIPQSLIEKFIEVISKNEDSFSEDEEYLSLKRFFMWCCLNPRAEVADSLYNFLIENSFRITKQGFFVALRNVVSLTEVHGSNEKVQFISNAYNKIKAVWKKKPSDYVVVENGGVYSLHKSNSGGNHDGKILGFLDELYIDLPNMIENRFTDDWTKTFDIRIGKIVRMPMDKCNWSTQDCAAAGLHFTSDQIHYVGCGDTSVLMLINPMKVVGIGVHKGRCYEYLPIMTVQTEEATEILHDLDFDTIDLDEFYIEYELDNLTQKAIEGFTFETNKHEFNLPSISSIQVDKIVESLNQIKNDIKKRVQEIV